MLVCLASIPLLLHCRAQSQGRFFAAPHQHSGMSSCNAPRSPQTWGSDGRFESQKLTPNVKHNVNPYKRVFKLSLNEQTVCENYISMFCLHFSRGSRQAGCSLQIPAQTSLARSLRAASALTCLDASSTGSSLMPACTSRPPALISAPQKQRFLRL